MIYPLSVEDQVWDLCVVGMGPVGMALDMEFERLGRDVLVLESGGTEINPALAEASHAEIVSPQNHCPMELAVCRALGGTSWTWGGRCVPYDDIDWMPRDYVADAHWPIGHDEIRSWYKGASEYMLCGSASFAIPYKQELTHGLRFDCLERWSSEQKLILHHRPRLLGSERIKLSLNSTVTNLNLSADEQRLESLTVSVAGATRTVRARQIVLAMGGVETTRLMLHAQQSWPRSFGGVGGPLGHYYMGHLSGKIARIHFNKSVDFEDLDFTRDPSGSYRRRRLTLTAETQLKHNLLNTAFWADNPRFYDPSHRSFALSSIYLALAFRPIGKRLTSEAIRQEQIGPGSDSLAAHFRNVILGAPRGAKDLYKILRDRFLIKPKKPLFLVPHPDGQYLLTYHAEQIPDFESRIGIGREVDSFGVPRAVIDRHLSQQDIQSVIDSHDVLDEALQSNGLGRLEYLYAREALPEQVRTGSVDGFHQVGTTRMGVDPARSVVDLNLKVHGVENLYVASSSVFPTSGQANSTYLAVAFALRLADRLNA